MRILHVEDDVTMAKTVELMLQGDGHTYNNTSLGERAVNMAKRNNYDLILLDVMLPDIDGYEVVRRLRESGVHTPFLIQSGLVDRDSQFAGLALGVGEYLIKPFTNDELRARIKAVLARADLDAGLNPFEGDNPCAAKKSDSERRQHRRFKTLKQGTIALGAGIDCKILNLSQGGAAIRLPEGSLDCPDSFDLSVRAGRTYHCRVRWRYGDRIGVKFV